MCRRSPANWWKEQFELLQAGKAKSLDNYYDDDNDDYDDDDDDDDEKCLILLRFGLFYNAFNIDIE
jgi:hypothetical protein